MITQGYPRPQASPLTLARRGGRPIIDRSSAGVEVSSLFVFREEKGSIPSWRLFFRPPQLPVSDPPFVFSHSLSRYRPYLPSSHFHTPLLRFSNFPPFVPISDIQSVSCSISMQMVDNGACVSPFDPCPVIIQYVRVTRDVITEFSRSSLSHCWRFTSELRKSG